MRCRFSTPCFILVMSVLSRSDGKSITQLTRRLIPEANQVCYNGTLFHEFYTVRESKKIKIGECSAVAHLYTLRNANLSRLRREDSDLSDSLVAIMSFGGGVVVPLSLDAESIRLVIPKSSRALVALYNHDFGNSLNCGGYEIVELDAKGVPRHMGRVTDISDVDGDGEDDLYTWYDTFEYVGMLSHADAPTVELFWHVEPGLGLVREVNRHLDFYSDKLEDIGGRVDDLIEQRVKGNDTDQVKLLQLIVEEFILHDIVGMDRKAWRKLDRRLRNCTSGSYQIYGESWSIASIKFEIMKDFCKHLMEAGKIEKAMEMVNLLAAHDRNDPCVAQMRGDILARLGDIEGALAAYKRSVGPDEQFMPIDIGTKIASLLVRTGRYGEAMQIYDGWQSFDGANGYWWRRKADLLVNLGYYKKCVDLYDNVMHEEGLDRDPELWYRKGCLWELAGDESATIEAYQRASELGDPVAILALDYLR